MRVTDLCQNLKYIDGTGAGSIEATLVLGMIYNLPMLNKLAVMPLKHETGAWQFMIFQYGRIIFGQCIAETLKCPGDPYRFAQNALESINEL